MVHQRLTYAALFACAVSVCVAGTCKPFEDENADALQELGGGPDATENEVVAAQKLVKLPPSEVKLGGKLVRRCRENTTFADGATSKEFTCVDQDLWDQEDVCKADHLQGGGDTLGRSVMGTVYALSIPTYSLNLGFSSTLLQAAASMHIKINGTDTSDWERSNTLNVPTESFLTPITSTFEAIGGTAPPLPADVKELLPDGDQ